MVGVRGKSPNTAEGAVVVEPGLEGLFRGEYEPMFRLAFTILRSVAAAEEVVQDAFVPVAQRWEQIDQPGGYLRMSVVNGARKRRGRRRSMAQLPDESSGVDAAIGVDVLELVEELPERERTAIVLRFYAGWNATEIGEVLDCPAGTVRSLLHRSLAMLKARLDDE